MAKVIIREASKDDPIFNGEFVISTQPKKSVAGRNNQGPLLSCTKHNAQVKENKRQNRKNSRSVSFSSSRKG